MIQLEGVCSLKSAERIGFDIASEESINRNEGMPDNIGVGDIQVGSLRQA